jgi:glycosyltransferase involved in cell wall biosynthesis
MKKATQPPLIAIGLPTYNRPAGLRRMVQALLAQTEQNFVLVVSDNASTQPEQQALLNELAAADPRITVVRSPTNVGMNGNFLNAFAHTAPFNAPYFVWAADDDYYHPGYLATCLEMMAAHPEAALTIPSVRMMNRASQPIFTYPSFTRFTNTGHAPGSWRRWWYMLRFVYEPLVYGKGTLPYGLFRRSVLEHTLAAWHPLAFAHPNGRTVWNGDNALLYPILARHTVVASPAVLMDKDLPTQRSAPYWFPLAFTYQTPVQHLPETWRCYRHVARGWPEHMQISLYVASLSVYWVTVGFPLKALALGLRWLAERRATR